jgi:hypothetical protein
MNSTASSENVSTKREAAAGDAISLLVARHLRVGWFAVLIFVAMGLALETLHGFKVQGYLSVANETRRLMWTLAHAHGALLGLAHLGFAFTLERAPAWPAGKRSFASWSLVAATILMPSGFLLGGIWTYAGDPGVGIVLVPAGGLLLLASVFLTFLAARSCSTAGVSRRRA